MTRNPLTKATTNPKKDGVAIKKHDVRRSKRFRREREMYQTEVVTRGVVTIERDEVCGMAQPGGTYMSEKERRDREEDLEGRHLYDEVLRGAGWGYIKGKAVTDPSWIFTGPNYSKDNARINENYFTSYQAIFQQFEKDGDTTDLILRRGQIDEEPQEQTSKASVSATNATCATAIPDGVVPFASGPTVEGVPVNQPKTDDNTDAESIPTAISQEDSATGTTNTAEASNPPAVVTHFNTVDIPTKQEAAGDDDTPMKQEDGDDASIEIVGDSSDPKPSEDLRTRLERLEKSLGFALSSQVIHRRITVLEGQCGVTAQGKSFLGRVAELEAIIGI
ncbi:expressed unknown protein [Seminavis robusta]|uniref:Uncharacterized protein n=1 Tax=Seminavis robusta TaxID=568900 RepID=A0A9N8E8J0_9STRA|nr:expressed unknown protein [Seminavis robusta]|eukprot:Sro611_g175340.1 n/a (334) ;mRNA; f:27858-28859